SACVRFVAKYQEEKNYGLLWGARVGGLGLGLISSLLFTSFAFGAFYLGQAFWATIMTGRC
ncbi:MAG: hypothetical protein AAF412_08135, partial [Pseudomonadota bacterium]